jgi:hypothetical protein
MPSACAIEVIGTLNLESAADANRDQLAGIRTWRDALGGSDAAAGELLPVLVGLTAEAALAVIAGSRPG